MKIYILDAYKYNIVPKQRPWPKHSVGFTMEIDFLNFLLQSNLLTNDPNEADWHYLPINWSFWLLSHNYGTEGREEMQQYINEVIIDDKKTFTITEADFTPNNFEIGLMKVFSANQSTKGEIPIPLLSLPHEFPPLPEKKYFASFVGSIRPWPMRIKMKELLKDRKDVCIIESKQGEELFVNTILSSYCTLCPRGSADSSYRFYESMQLGVSPIMINEVDFRPFPAQIDWNCCSYFVDSPEKLPMLLSTVSGKELLHKGNVAKIIWNNLAGYGWCRMLLDYLI